MDPPIDGWSDELSWMDGNCNCNCQLCFVFVVCSLVCVFEREREWIRRNSVYVALYISNHIAFNPMTVYGLLFRCYFRSFSFMETYTNDFLYNDVRTMACLLSHFEFFYHENGYTQRR